MIDSGWTKYRKSSHSGGVSNGCIALSFGPGAVRIIDSKLGESGSPVLEIPAENFELFLDYAKSR